MAGCTICSQNCSFDAIEGERKVKHMVVDENAQAVGYVQVNAQQMHNYEEDNDGENICKTIKGDILLYIENDKDVHGIYYFGDILDVLEALLPKYEGQIQLIYMDPPFLLDRYLNINSG